MQVNEAVDLLNDYNARLAAEMEERTKLATMLRDFQAEQKELLSQAEQRLDVRFPARLACYLTRGLLDKVPKWLFKKDLIKISKKLAQNAFHYYSPMFPNIGKLEIHVESYLLLNSANF